MAWVILVVAGLLEVAWALGLKASHGFSRPLPSLFTILAMVASLYLLAQAMKVLPVGNCLRHLGGDWCGGYGLAGNSNLWR